MTRDNPAEFYSMIQTLEKKEREKRIARSAFVGDVVQLGETTDPLTKKKFETV